MQCPACGYSRKTTDTAPVEQCPLCQVFYNKIQCGLYWTPALTLLPESVTKAYVITPDFKWHAVNKVQKNAVKQIAISEEQNKRLIEALEMAVPDIDIDVIEIVPALNFEQLNIIYTITGHSFFDFGAQYPPKKDDDITTSEQVNKASKSSGTHKCKNQEPSSCHANKQGNNLLQGVTNFLYKFKRAEPQALICQQCGGQMIQSTLGYGSLVGITMALIVFILGILFLVFLFWTIIGAIIGIVLIVKGLLMGGTKQKIWKCQSCGFYFNRL